MTTPSQSPSAPISDRYEPAAVEERWYPEWEQRGYFQVDPASDKPPYCIVIPPPNVTGALHMGHAFTFTLQDVLIRLKRMDGFNTLWQPGTDHAGIATQVVVERQLAAEGKTKEDLGREAFVARVWKWKEESGGTIIRQLKQLGASCDWSRERFTMDEGLSRAVREVFVRLYDEGLIYRDDRIVNWCPRCQTVLSDLEVEREERDAEFVYIKYGPLTLGTVRPETKLGDTGLAVHPNDPRYAQYVGRELEIQSVSGPITMRVVADEAVDPEFGTGVIKVTPGHDPVDFEIGKRHGLPIRTVIGFDGKMTAAAGKYAGHGPLRDAQEDRRGHAGAGAHRPHRAVPSRHRALLSLQDRGGAARLQAVVRQRQAAGRGGAGGRARRAHHHRAVGVDEDLRPVDGEHSSVVYLAPAVVGPPDSRVVLRQGRLDPRLPHRPQRVSAMRWLASPGSRRARHVVLVGTLAVLHAGLARRDAGAAQVLPDLGAGDGLRHHLLLGRADGHAGAALHEGGAVPRRLHPRSRARRRGAEDVEVEGQRRRSPRDHDQVRDRRVPLHAGGAGGPGPRYPDQRRARRGLPQLRQQALERLAPGAVQSRRLRPAGRPHAGRTAGPLDPEPAAGDDHQRS